MRLGTPGFSGRCLREAREARGLTAISLADLVCVTRSAVSHYENDEQSPSPEVMKRIAGVLNLPEAYFRQQMATRQYGTIFYRSMSATTKGARRRSEQRYEWLRRIVAYLRNYVDLPRVDWPSFDFPDDPNRISMGEIEECAAKTRARWGLGEGPILNMVSVLENNGAIIARDELAADTLDAFSEFDPEEQVPYFTLGIDKASAVRSRFDAAHELGHMVIHRNQKSLKLGNKPEYALIEQQAHRFAAAFLLPEKSFASEFYSATLDALLSLKKKWKVSIAMMIIRAEHLGFIDQTTSKRLWINYSRRGWRKCEPLDDEIPIEQPKLLKRAFEMLVQERILTPPRILLDLPLAPEDIEQLSGLDSGFLSSKVIDDSPPVRLLSPRKMRDADRPSEPAQVISFPNRGKDAK